MLFIIKLNYQLNYEIIMGNNPCIIGVGGATRSGKTSLCKNIIKYLNSDEKHIIHLDDFFSLELLYKYKNNWEIPEVIEWDYLIEDIENIKYNISYKNQKFVLVEGFLIFKQPLFYKFNKSIFIWVSKEEGKKRRMETKPVPEDYYESLVWPNYLRNNFHLAKMKLNKEKMLGKDILVLDSTKETIEEMSQKAIKFIFNEKDFKRDLIREQNLLNNIEEEYKKLENKEK